MSSYIKVHESGSPDEITEVPLEDDDTVSLETLKSSFPGAVGLKIKVGEKSTRAVRNVTGILHPRDATTDDDIESIAYICVMDKTTVTSGNKRSRDEDDGQSTGDFQQPTKQAPKLEIIVLGIPYGETAEGIKTYFETYGEVESVDIKRYPDGKSRGFCFVVFKEANVASAVIADQHELGGRSLEVKYPFDRNSRNHNNNFHQGNNGGAGPSFRAPPPMPEIRKIFVGKVTSDITDENLRKHFSEFGELSDVYIPQNPFRHIAYVEFKLAESMERALTATHTVEGVELNIQKAIPKNGGRFGSGGYNGGYNNYNNHGNFGYNNGPHFNGRYGGYNNNFRGGGRGGYNNHNGNYHNNFNKHHHHHHHRHGNGHQVHQGNNINNGGHGNNNDMWANNNNYNNGNQGSNNQANNSQNNNSSNMWSDQNQGNNDGRNWSQGQTNNGYNNYGNQMSFQQQQQPGNNQGYF